MNRKTLSHLNDGKSTGPGPSPERFAEAVRHLEERGHKLTVRAIEALAGGTRSVTTRLLRELRAQREASETELDLPEAFVQASKRLIIQAAEQAELRWRERFHAAQDAHRELESLLEDAEQQEAKARSESDLWRVAAATREEILERELQAHASTRHQLAELQEAMNAARLEAARFQGELEGALLIANARELALMAERKAADQLRGRIEQLAREVGELKAQTAPRDR